MGIGWDDVISKVVLPRYMKVTRDGTKLGPTWWASVLGAETAQTISERVRRLKTRPGGQREASSTATPVEIRRAKSDLRKPGVV
jgi:hypothetical protein